MAGRMHLIVGEPLGDRLADPLRPTRHDDHAAHAASAFRSSLPDGVFGRSSTNTTSRGYLCGESRSRTKSWSACSSTGCRTTTYARGIVNPFRAAPTTAHSTTSGWPTRQCSISAGATQIPPTLIRSSTRPRYQKKPSSSRSNRSPVWTVSPSNVRLRLLVVAPVVERGRVAGDEQLAGLGDLGLVARHELAGRAGSRAAGPVRDVDVVQLARADPVQHLDAERVEPAVVQLARQRLAGRRAHAQTGHVRCLAPAMSDGVDHLRHHRRHVDEDRRPVLGDQLEDPLRRRALREDDPRAADAERVERGQVARVAEEELRHGQHDVVLADPEHARARTTRG